MIQHLVFNAKHIEKNPSKHAVSDSRPVRIGWEAALARSGPDDCCTPASFRTGSVWPQPDTIRQNYIGPGLVLHNIIRDVCGRTQPILKVGKLVAGRLLSAGTGPDDSCTPACFRTRCVWSKPDQARPDRIRVGFAQYGPGLLWKNGTESDAGR